jgi:hypothetical protein
MRDKYGYIHTSANGHSTLGLIFKSRWKSGTADDVKYRHRLYHWIKKNLKEPIDGKCEKC